MAASEELMSSIDSKCTPLKTQYDSCFNDWFKNSFLIGKDNHDEKCGELFITYQKCLKAALIEKGLPMSELQKDMLNTVEERQPPK